MAVQSAFEKANNLPAGTESSMFMTGGTSKVTNPAPKTTTNTGSPIGNITMTYNKTTPTATTYDPTTKSNKTYSATSGGATSSNPVTSFTTSSGKTVNNSKPIIQQPQAYNPEEAQKYIKELFDQESKAKMALLDKQRTQTISGLQGLKTKINPYYTQEKNTLAGQNRQNARSLAEYLANRGQARSGASVTGEIARNTELQRGMSNLAQDEANAYSDIDRKVTDADNNYFADVTATEASLMGNMTKAMYDEYIRGSEIQRKLEEQKKKETDAYYALDNMVRNPTTDTYEKDPSYENKIKQEAMTVPDYNKNYKDLGYVNPYAGVQVPQEYRTALEPYRDNYASVAQGNSDPMMSYYANVLSAEKMFNSPDLLSQYGDRFRTPDATNTLASANKTMTETQIKANEPVYKQNAGIIMANIISSNADPATIATEIMNNPEMAEQLGSEYPNVIKFLQDASIEKQKAELEGRKFDWSKFVDGRQLDISQQNADTSSSRLEYDRNKPNTEKESPYFSETNKALNDYLNGLTRTERNYIGIPTSVENIRAANYILGSNASEEEKVSMFNMSGVADPRK